ncbi:hypothetical protein F5B17DRAFT_107083 [Nemania serpens]|nr:hypothetical protein F5B17DRAFT_107083 [Nemania serpens]
MAGQTFSSTSTSSDYYIPSTSTSGPPPSYAQELDIPGTSGTSGSGTSNAGPSGSRTSASAGNTDKPLMSYSISFNSNWQKDFGNGMGSQYQQQSAWSTRGNAGSNP